MNSAVQHAAAAGLPASGSSPAGRAAGAGRRGRRDPRAVRWGWFLWPTVAVSFVLLVLPQLGFVWMSLHADLGLGQTGDVVTLANYREILSDPFYLRSIWITLYLSVATVVVVVLVGLPTAYALARMSPLPASILLGLILTTSLITVVIKLLGLNIILGSSGMVNAALLGLGIASAPLQLVNNEAGVLIGLVQYTLPLFVMLLFSVIQTIPRSLEEAAEIHGATRLSIFLRVILPLAKAGILAGSLITLNMSMGAFTSAILLGGGRVHTMPVLIQQKIVQSSEYGIGAALSTVLLVFVFLLNLAVGAWAGRSGGRARR
ncbi:MAG: transporter, rane spanning protein polyamine [Enterovirga sp.]|nr:transporter, rane spanning protein polyamine [Enterovirga sp.]